MLLNRKLLAKIMEMTASDKDGEALNAARMATSMVKDAGMTWEQLLAEPAQRQVTVTVTRHAPPQQQEQPEGWVPPHLTDKVTIDMMFRALFAQPRTGNEEFWQTMESIHNHFQKYGALTQGQYSALRRCYARTLRA